MLVLVVLFMVVLFGMAAMVIDVGYAYYAHRNMQATWTPPPSREPRSSRIHPEPKRSPTSTAGRPAGRTSPKTSTETINCQRGGGRTAYAHALEQAQVELDCAGRADVQNVIVFLSDGAANIGPTYYSTTSSYRRQPCRQGVWSAEAIKARGTWIYSIGYDLDALDGGANTC